MKKKNIQLAGHNTSYIEAGEGNETRVVLIHDGAFGTTAELCWAGVIEDLAHDFHVIAPELYGWGDSDKHYPFGQSPYGYRIEQVKLLLNHLDADESYFVGVSFGGSLVLRATMAEGDPWRVKGAISIAGAGGMYRPQSAVEALAEYTPSYDEAKRLTEMMVVSTDGLDDHIQQRYENSLIAGHWECLMAPQLKNPTAVPDRQKDDFSEQLTRVDVPILFVEGKYDELLEHGWASKLSELAPTGSSIVLDSSHEPNIDQPLEVAHVVRTFVASSHLVGASASEQGDNKHGRR